MANRHVHGAQAGKPGRGAPTVELNGHPAVFEQSALIVDEGDLLVELLKGVNINPEDCYRTQVVACRPILIIPQTDDEDERVETVPPTKEHYEGVYNKEEKVWSRSGCNTRLLAQIYEVDPRIIITLGDVPLKFLKSRDNGGKLPRKMSEAQGDLFEISIPGVHQTLRYPVIAALNMVYLIKNPSTAAHGPIAVVMEALRRAQTYVAWTKKREEI